jgi:hypothetical protein
MRELADEVERELAVFADCRELLSRGVGTAGDAAISLENDCIVVRVAGREVAREWLEHDREDWFFEDGPWVRAIEEASQTVFEALPAAA